MAHWGLSSVSCPLGRRVAGGRPCLLCYNPLPSKPGPSVYYPRHPRPQLPFPSPHSITSQAAPTRTHLSAPTTGRHQPGLSRPPAGRSVSSPSACFPARTTPAPHTPPTSQAPRPQPIPCRGKYKPTPAPTTPSRYSPYPPDPIPPQVRPVPHRYILRRTTYIPYPTYSRRTVPHTPHARPSQADPQGPVHQARGPAISPRS